MTVAIHNLTDTWDAAGTTFTAIKMNVTDTASHADSRLMALQIGGGDIHAFTKGAAWQFGTPSTYANSIYATGFTGISFGINGVTTDVFAMRAQGGFHVRSGGYFGFSSNASFSATTSDVNLYRDAAGVLAQRVTTNAQTFNIYNTWTNSTNYERGFFKWNANVFEIGAEAAGTGTARPLSFPGADIRMANLPTADPTVAGRLWNNAGVVTVSAG